MKVLMTILIMMVIVASVFIIGCGGGNAITGEKTYHCEPGRGFDLNDSGAIIVYPGDYIHILNYRCEDCHSVEHRPNP